MRFERGETKEKKTVSLILLNIYIRKELFYSNFKQTKRIKFQEYFIKFWLKNSENSVAEDWILNTP